MAKKEPRTCERCGMEWLEPVDSDEKFCPSCRKEDPLSLGFQEPNNRNGLRF